MKPLESQTPSTTILALVRHFSFVSVVSRQQSKKQHHSALPPIRASHLVGLEKITGLNDRTHDPELTGWNSVVYFLFFQPIRSKVETSDVNAVFPRLTRAAWQEARES